MKKIFTLLSAMVVMGVSAQEQTLTQFSNPDVYNDSTPLCSTPVGQPSEPILNHNTRVFDLASYGITSSFTPTKVDVFGSGMAGAALMVEAAIVNGDPTVEGSLVMTEAFGSYSYAEALQDSWISIELLDTHTFDGGSKFAVAVGYEYDRDGIRFWMGNNDTAQNPETSPSYIGFPNTGCVANEPTPVSDLGFPVSWLFSVTGTVEGMGTVELNSRDLTVFPNPVSDVLNVNMANGKAAQSIEIVNMAGQSVFSAKATNSVNVNFLSSGVYIVRVKDNNGVTHMSKIVKK